MSNRTYRVVSTHLEEFNRQVRAAQAAAAELTGVLEAEDLPIILLDDFNSSPGIDYQNTYLAMTK